MRTYVRYARLVRDLGTPRDRFRRAINAGNLQIAEAALREMDAGAGVAQALELIALMAKRRDARYERAAARWVALVTEQRDLPLEETRTLLAIVALLPSTPELIATLRRRIQAPGAPR